MVEYMEREAAMTTPVLPKEYRQYQTDNLDDAYEQGWFDALDNLKNAPAVSVPQWISVKDRLPEAEQEVLVISRGWGDRLLYVGQYKKMEAQTSPLTGITSKESDWLLWGWSYLREPQVTHWMPLPEPPKGENDG